MNEFERVKAIQAAQLELFQIKREYRSRQRKIKRTLILLKANGVKVCRRCREEMDVEQFYKDDRYLDGWYPYCRECQQRKKAA